MGSLGLTGAQLSAFQSNIFATGLDLGRCKCDFIPGVWSADPAAVIRAGMMVSLNSSNLLIAATGLNVLGVARWNQMTVGQAVNVDEQVTLPGTTVVNLKRANVSNVAVRSLANQGGTLYVSATDYTLNASNGTLQRIALGAITDGQTVFVSYSFALTQADYQFQGKNFFNSLDDVAQAAGRLAIMMGPALIFTTEYDTSKSYAMTGVGSDLFCNASGQFTNVVANNFVGKVIQLPSAADPYLGIRLNAQAAQE